MPWRLASTPSQGTLDQGAKASECVLTGTAAEVTPVREIAPYKFTPGAVCKTLISDFEAAVKPRAKATAAE